MVIGHDDSCGICEDRADVLCALILVLFITIDIVQPLLVLMHGLRLGRG